MSRNKGEPHLLQLTHAATLACNTHRIHRTAHAGGVHERIRLHQLVVAVYCIARHHLDLCACVVSTLTFNTCYGRAVGHQLLGCSRGSKAFCDFGSHGHAVAAKNAIETSLNTLQVDGEIVIVQVNLIGLIATRTRMCAACSFVTFLALRSSSSMYFSDDLASSASSIEHACCTHTPRCTNICRSTLKPLKLIII